MLIASLSPKTGTGHLRSSPGCQFHGGALELGMQTRPHKAILREDKFQESLLWWTKSCNSDRAAETPVPLPDALAKWAKFEERRQQHSTAVPDFCPPREAALYCYFGGGVAHQPEMVAAVVVRASGLLAAVSAVIAARLPSLRGPSQVSLAVARARIHCNWEPDPPLTSEGQADAFFMAAEDAARVLSTSLGPALVCKVLGQHLLHICCLFWCSTHLHS